MLRCAIKTIRAVSPRSTPIRSSVKSLYGSLADLNQPKSRPEVNNLHKLFPAAINVQGNEFLRCFPKYFTTMPASTTAVPTKTEETVIMTEEKIHAYYQSLRENFALINDKAVKDLTVDDFTLYARETGIFTKEEEREIQERAFNGGMLLNLPNIAISSELKKKLDRHLFQRLNRAVAWSPLPSTLTHEEIKEEIEKTVDLVDSVLKLSQDLEYQKANISPLVQRPLPLTSDATKWRSYFFDDVGDSSSNDFHKLSEQIEATKQATLQNKKLISVVQMSGVGKTHMAITYARKVGGVIINFQKGVHKPILEMATNFIGAQRQYIKPTAENTSDEMYSKEVQYRDVSTQVLKLIQLTFLEFAKYFFEAAGKIPEDERHTALIRATLNKGKSIILKMFIHNLQYLQSQQEYSNFEIEMHHIAVKHNLTTIFFDEANAGEDNLIGQFIHYAPEEYKTIVMKQLEIEKENKFKETKLFSRPTSIFYLLILAIENLTKQYNYAHVLLSTSWKMSSLCPRTSCERLQVATVIPADSSVQLVERFKKVVANTFGDKVRALLDEHHLTLTHLSGRSLYLFGAFEQPIPQTTNERQFVHEWLATAERAAKNHALSYVQEAGIIPESPDGNIGLTANHHKLQYIKQLQQAIARIALGTDQTELDQIAIQNLLGLGLIKLTSDREDCKQQVELKHVIDYYICLEFKKQAFRTLLELFCSFLANKEKGYNGEYLLVLLLKWASEGGGKPLSQLVPFSEVPETIKSLKLQDNIIVTRPDDSDITYQHQIFDSQLGLQIGCFKPTSMLGPDYVLQLTQNNKLVGHLVVQSKNWRQSVGLKPFLEVALPALNPINFYHRGENVEVPRKDWNQSKFLNVLDNVWVRAVYAQGFTQNVWKIVRLWNSSNEGAKFPILLLTPNIVPEFTTEDMIERFKALGVARKAGAYKEQKLDKLTLTEEEKKMLSIH